MSTTSSVVNANIKETEMASPLPKSETTLPRGRLPKSNKVVPQKRSPSRPTRLPIIEPELLGFNHNGIGYDSKGYWVIEPNSRVSFIYAYTLYITCFFILFLWPAMLCFVPLRDEETTSTFFLKVSYFIDFFRFMDMWFQCRLTQHDRSGKFLREHSQIREKYLRTQLRHDVISLFPLEIIGYAMGHRFASRELWMYRANRMWTAKRLFDLKKKDHCLHTNALVKFITTVVGLVFSTHVLACIFFKFGELTEESWVS